MKANLFIHLNVSETGYIIIKEMFYEGKIMERYKDMVETAKMFNAKAESFEGFKLRYLFITVEYDGRRKQITENDVIKSLEKQGLAKKIGDNIFGGYYKITDKLKAILDDQMNKRKALAGVA